MTTPLRHRLLAGLCFALAGAAALPAQAQLARPSSAASDTTVLPIWNHDSGRVEALLLLENVPVRQDANDARFLAPQVGTEAAGSTGATGLSANLRLEPRSNLALLCNGESGVAMTLGGLAGQCMLAQMDERSGSGGARLGVEARVDAGASSVSLGAGTTRGTLDDAALPLAGGDAMVQLSQSNPLLPFGMSGRYDAQDLGLAAGMRLGSDGWVSIAGNVSRARLVPANDAAAAMLPDEWDTTTLDVGAGYGAFSGSVIGRVVEAQGRESSFGSLGLGVSWHTPWRARLSVGAENIVTRGRNPWSSNAGEDGEGTGSIPYVRYQQDL